MAAGPVYPEVTSRLVEMMVLHEVSEAEAAQSTISVTLMAAGDEVTGRGTHRCRIARRLTAEKAEEGVTKAEHLPQRSQEEP